MKKCLKSEVVIKSHSFSHSIPLTDTSYTIKTNHKEGLLIWLILDKYHLFITCDTDVFLLLLLLFLCVLLLFVFFLLYKEINYHNIASLIWPSNEKRLSCQNVHIALKTNALWQRFIAAYTTFFLINLFVTLKLEKSPNLFRFILMFFFIVCLIVCPFVCVFFPSHFLIS